MHRVHGGAPHLPPRERERRGGTAWTIIGWRDGGTGWWLAMGERGRERARELGLEVRKRDCERERLPEREREL